MDLANTGCEARKEVEQLDSPSKGTAHTSRSNSELSVCVCKCLCNFGAIRGN